MIGITILGATGSIGRNTLDVLSRHSDRFNIVALTANDKVNEMAELCRRVQPVYAVMRDESAADQLAQLLQPTHPFIQILQGEAGLQHVASLPEVDAVLCGIVGAPGLLSTLAAARAGKRILLANKEALVMAGELLFKEIQISGAELLPVDSEHSAVLQCMPADFVIGKQHSAVKQIILTASGGPFRVTPLHKLAQVTPEQACAHPNWKMGRKISVDSATMINKALEVIEAYWLFRLPLQQITLLLHPQSIIHSLVEYIDGSVLAQMGNPDMRVPISCALAWPQRIESGTVALDLAKIGRLDFAELDLTRYPGARLAYQALATGGTAATILNAANEVLVEAFLAEKIRFVDIVPGIEKVLSRVSSHAAVDLQVILSDDVCARNCAHEVVQKLTETQNHFAF